MTVLVNGYIPYRPVSFCHYLTYLYYAYNIYYTLSYLSVAQKNVTVEKLRKRAFAKNSL